MREYSTWGAAQQYRKITHRGAGVGQAIAADEVPQEILVNFSSFAGGYNVADDPEDIPEQDQTVLENVEITDVDALQMTSGYVLDEQLAGGRKVKSMFVQTSLDYTSELLMFDGVYIGVKTNGATTWTDASLPTGDEWVGVNYAGEALLTNRATGIYVRVAGGAPGITLVPDSVPARTLFFVGDRLFLGGTYVGGTYEALGIRWVGVGGYTDWDGLNGAGFELLVSPYGTDDRIVAGRSWGKDAIILCEHSIWYAQWTGDGRRPADFSLREPGIGCLAEPTAVVTPVGVIFLSESGVVLFDGNRATIISRKINAELLPIMQGSLNFYSAVYEPEKNQYYLFTPSCTWVFDMNYNRWFKRTQVVFRAVLFAQQVSGTTWATSASTWAGSAGKTWASFAATQLSKQLMFTDRDNLYRPANNGLDMSDTTMTARVRFRKTSAAGYKQQFTAIRALIRYTNDDLTYDSGPSANAPSDVALYMTDVDGDFVHVRTASLALQLVAKSVAIGIIPRTGEGATLELQWTDPLLNIFSAGVVGRFRSQAIGKL